MLVRLSGIFTLSKPMQTLKALRPMLVTPSGIVKRVMPWQ